MRLIELLESGRTKIVHHPAIGYCRWFPEFKGSPHHILYFVGGGDGGKALECDEATLFDETWELATPQDVRAFTRECDDGVINTTCQNCLCRIARHDYRRNPRGPCGACDCPKYEFFYAEGEG